MIKILLFAALVAGALCNPIAQADSDSSVDLKEEGSSAYAGPAQPAAYAGKNNGDGNGSNGGASNGGNAYAQPQQQQQQYDPQPWTPTDNGQSNNQANYGQQQQNNYGQQQSNNYGQEQNNYGGQEQGGYDNAPYGSEEGQYDQSGYENAGYDQAAAYGGEDTSAPAYDQGGYDGGYAQPAAYGQSNYNGQPDYNPPANYAPQVSSYNNPPTQQPEQPAPAGNGYNAPAPAPAPAQASYGGFQPISGAKAAGYAKPLVLEIVQTNAGAYQAQPAQPAQPAPAPAKPAPAGGNYNAKPQQPSYGSGQQQEQYEAYTPEGYGQEMYKKPQGSPSPYSNAGYNLDYAAGKPYHGDFTQKPYGTQFPAGLFSAADYGGQEVNVPFNFGGGLAAALGGYGGQAESQLDLSALYGGQSGDQSALYSQLAGQLGDEASVYGLSGLGDHGVKENRYKAAASKLIPNIVRAPFRTIYNALTKSRFLGR